jgi:hypothetical protein
MARKRASDLPRVTRAPHFFFTEWLENSTKGGSAYDAVPAEEFYKKARDVTTRKSKDALVKYALAHKILHRTYCNQSQPSLGKSFWH